MSETLQTDLCVIGAGSGGLSVAAAAAAMGVPVVLIEKGRMGGDCLNYGCVPSKALIAAARAAHETRRAARFGVRSTEPQIDWAQVRAHVRGVIGAIEPTDSEERFRAMGVHVIRGKARFIGADRVEANGVEIRARRFVIATGSSPRMPNIPGIEFARCLTNETIFDLEEAPSRLAVIGAGAVGVELAQAFRRLGCDVLVLEAGRALAKEDPELAAPALAALRREGVEVREGARIVRFDPVHSGAQLVLEREGGEEIVTASHVLVAVGRAPNIHDLGLDLARVAHDERGVSVRKGVRTTNRRVYAIGDATGGPQFTHAANHQAGLVLRSALFRLPTRARPEIIPRVTYADPEIAVAGLTEEQARATHKKLEVLRWPFVENDRARAEGRTEGLIKIVATPGGRVLGAGIVGAHAGELIAPWQMAITKGMNVADIAGLVLPYPTLSEVSRRAAILHYAPKLRSHMLQRVLKAIRWLG